VINENHFLLSIKNTELLKCVLFKFKVIIEDSPFWISGSKNVVHAYRFVPNNRSLPFEVLNSVLRNAKLLLFKVDVNKIFEGKVVKCFLLKAYETVYIADDKFTRVHFLVPLYSANNVFRCFQFRILRYFRFLLGFIRRFWFRDYFCIFVWWRSVFWSQSGLIFCAPDCFRCYLLLS